MTDKKKRQSKYPPYAQARQMALELQLSSRKAYQDWHKSTKCEYIPRFPERVYKEWISWNDYLGTANVFKGEVVKPLRPFWDAVKFAQEIASLHQMNTMADWLAYWKDHIEELPDDIPLRPDQRYIEWPQVGSKGWLGIDLRGRLVAAKQSTALLAICSNHNLRKPGNVYAIIQAERGEVELIAMLEKARDLVPVRFYKLPNECKEEVMDCVKRHGRNDSGGWFIPNMHNLLFDLDMLLVIHHMRPVQHKAIEVDLDEFMFPDRVYTHRLV